VKFHETLFTEIVVGALDDFLIIICNSAILTITDFWVGGMRSQYCIVAYTCL